MMDEAEEVKTDPKASGPILSALSKAHNDQSFVKWRAVCTQIERSYGETGGVLDTIIFNDGADVASGNNLALFWASYEVLKPAVYAKAPIPAVAPIFKDGNIVVDTTAEVLERCGIVALAQNNIDHTMKLVRDDLLFYGRGVLWLTYESEDGQRVCIEHVDRNDFRHDCAAYWDRVGWVAKRSWLTKAEMAERFTKKIAEEARYDTRREDGNGIFSDAVTRKCGVWEVWHRGDKRVYWVSEGFPYILDQNEPHLKLKDFFPCPRPAYGTTQLRSLVPIPDWEHYAPHFAKINELTGRIYGLIDWVKMKGLVPGGGDQAEAVRQALASTDDTIIVGVPGALLSGNGGADFVQWLPLTEIAQAITGLIEARNQFIDNLYQLSGISDIMRGATEAQETLGAQQLKTQYGSVRVREKIDEIQRIAANAVQIASEIIADKFTQKSILDMCQIPLLTKSEIDKRIDKIKAGAEAELKGLTKKFDELEAKQRADFEAQAQQEGADPQALEQQAKQIAEQAKAEYQQAQQQVIQKYAGMLNEAESQVSIDAVMELLRDDKVRSFTFDIQSDSTILTDEIQEKQSRAEFMTAFNNVSQPLMGMMAMGEEGANLAGEMMKFALAPYRSGRQLEGAIDAFIKVAPEMAAKMQGEQGDTDGLIEAQNKLADAEMEKAKAAMAGVQAKAQLDQANMQAKMTELQQKSFEAEQKAQLEIGKLQLSATKQEQEFTAKMAEMDAKQNLMQAQTAEILSRIGLDARRQDLEEYRTAADVEARATDQAMAVEGQQVDQQFRSAEHERADRGEERADRQQDMSERTGERQMTLAERQAERGDE